MTPRGVRGSSMRPLRVAALLALLLLASLVPGANAQGVLLQASRSGADVVVEVENVGAAFQGRILAWHDDPFTGRIVDRLAPVTVEGNARTTFVLPRVRADVALRIELLAEDDGPDREPRTRLFDPSTVGSSRPIATAAVGASSPWSPAAAFPVTSVSAYGNESRLNGLRSLTTRDGFLLIAWEWGEDIFVVSSRDGGRTFSAPTVVTWSTDEGRARWGMGELADGRVRFLWHEVAHERLTAEEAAARSWRYSDIDPASPGMGDIGSLTFDVMGAWTWQDGRLDIEVLPNGSALVAARTPTSPGGVDVWLVAQEQGPLRLAQVVVGETYDFALAVNGDRVALLHIEAGEFSDHRAFLSTSGDGGRTWTSPGELRALTRRYDRGLSSFGAVLLDEEGAVHAGAHAFGPTALAVPLRFRHGADGATSIEEPPTGVAPAVAVQGARVWTAYATANGTLLRESTDGGRTFAAAHHVAPVASETASPSWNLGTLAVLPDGRPVLAGMSVDHRGDWIYGIGAVPVFDPEPADASIVLRRVDLAQATSPPPPTPQPTTPSPSASPTPASPSPTRGAEPTPPTSTRPTPPITDRDPAAARAVAVAMGAGAALGLAGLLAWAARSDLIRLLAGAAILPLYTRLKRSDVLTNDVRAGIFEHVRANPGVRFEEMRRALALPAGVLTFHLRVLERERFVTVEREWTRRRYYPVGGARLPAPARDVATTLASLLAREPGLGAGEVARRLGISRQLARYHLRRLELEGRLVAEGAGLRVGYRLRHP